MLSERIWTFEAGDDVPEWFLHPVNCFLTFGRDAVVVEQPGAFQLYPMSAMEPDDPIILAHVIDRDLEVSVEHVLPITTHVEPLKTLLN